MMDALATKPALQAFQLMRLSWATVTGQPVASLAWLASVRPDGLVLALRDQRPPAALLPVGQALELQFTTVNGPAMVPARLRQYAEGLGLLLIHLSGAVTLHDRRRFPRVSVHLPPVPARRLARERERQLECHVSLNDLSIGGARFVSPQPVGTLDRLALELTIDEDGPIRPVLTVLEASPLAATPAGASYLVRGAFTAISEDEQQRLGRYVTRRQVAELATFV